MLLATLSVALVVASYLSRNEARCDPYCPDLPYVVAFAALGFFGAAVSVSIGQLSKPRPPSVRRKIKVGGAIYLFASVASIFAGATSASAVFVLTAFIMAVMIAWGMIDRGEIRGTVAGRIVAGSLVLYVVSLTAIAYDASCDPTCLETSIFVPFVSLGLFGAALGLSIGQLFRLRPAYVRLAIRVSIAIYLVASVTILFFSVGVLAVAFVATAVVMIGASRRHPQSTLSVDAPVH